TFWLTRWMAARHPLGGVVGMLLGTALRILVAFGGGAVVFLLTPMFRDAVLGYWLWLLFAYLASLVAGTGLLGGLSPVGGSGAGRRAGRGDRMLLLLAQAVEKKQLAPFSHVRDSHYIEIFESIGWEIDLSPFTKFQVFIVLSAVIVAVAMIWLAAKMRTGE